MKTSIYLGNRRLLRLARILDTADAEHSVAGEPGYAQSITVHPCGTPACAAGHYAAHTPARWSIMKRKGSIVRKGSSSYKWLEDLGDEFALNEFDAIKVFGYHGCGGAVTAKDAAQYVRNFVASRTE